MTTFDPRQAASLSGESRVLPEQECLDLLTTTTVGRVAFVNAEGLQLVPLNFAVIDGEIYFRTAPESILDDLVAGDAQVAFAVDYHSEQFREGWSVTVKGTATRVQDPDLHAQVMSWRTLRPWAGGTREIVLHLSRRTIEGRRVHGNRPPTGVSSAVQP